MAVINFAGLASGIDSTALIDATSEASRQTRVKPNQTKVEELTATNDALDKVTEKLETIRTSLQQFSTLAGGGVSKTASSSRESVATATASNAASNGTYALTVSQLARNHTLSYTNGGAGFSSSTAAIETGLTGAESAANRTVTYTIGQGVNQETVNVEISGPTYTITDFVNAFNSASSKAEASIVNVGTTSSPAYYVVITSNNEGEDKGLIADSYGANLSNISNVLNREESVAENAEFNIAGIGDIVRGSNTINDVLPGVTLSLASTGTASVRISEDAATTQSKVQEFIDAYNDLVTYMTENNAITRDESGTELKNNFGPLASSSSDDSALSAIRSAISEAVATGGSAVNILADLGITTQRDGTLAFDTSKFQTAIAAEPSSVGSVLQNFADTVASTGGTIDIFTRFNGILDITINGNKTLISNLNERIAEAERQIERQADAMRQRFARLESLVGKLQQQQSSLTSALAGLGR